MKKILASFFACLVLALPVYAASVVTGGLDVTAKQAEITTGATKDSLPILWGALINYAFGIVGVVFIIIILIGGYQWMTANGDEDNVMTAKKRILNGIFGLMVIFLSYVLVYTILSAVEKAANGTT